MLSFAAVVGHRLPDNSQLVGKALSDALGVLGVEGPRILSWQRDGQRARLFALS